MGGRRGMFNNLVLTTENVELIRSALSVYLGCCPLESRQYKKTEQLLRMMEKRLGHEAVNA